MDSGTSFHRLCKAGIDEGVGVPRLHAKMLAENRKRTASGNPGPNLRNTASVAGGWRQRNRIFERDAEGVVRFERL
jgi:hypothetical protein